MPRFAIKPRRYYDQNEAIADKVRAYLEAGHTIDLERDPNSKMSLLAWANMEITRLREKCGEKPVDKRTKIIVGPRPVAGSKPVRLEDAAAACQDMVRISQEALRGTIKLPGGPPADDK